MTNALFHVNVVAALGKPKNGRVECAFPVVSEVPSNDSQEELFEWYDSVVARIKQSVTQTYPNVVPSSIIPTITRLI